MSPDKMKEIKLKIAIAEAAREKESRERSKCTDCGVDTRHYSHTFNCRWRGSGF